MGRLSTHVLDTAQGRPAAGMRVTLQSIGAQGEATTLQVVELNADGRNPNGPLLEGGAMAAGPGAVASGASAPAATPRPPRRIQLPQLARLRGNEALALVQSDDFLSRMSGLLNLHVIDPADAEVRQQLAELRRLLGQIWLDTPLEQMEVLYRSSFGELYRNVLASHNGCF